MATPTNSSWRHFDLMMRLLGLYVGLALLLWLVAVGGGFLADVGNPSGEARGVVFMANVLEARPYIYLAVSFLFLLLIRFRNIPCLIVNSLTFALSAYFAL